MATHTLPWRVIDNHERVFEVLHSFFEHRQAWGVSITNVGFSGGRLTLTVSPDLTPAQIDHLLGN